MRLCIWSAQTQDYALHPLRLCSVFFSQLNGSFRRLSRCGSVSLFLIASLWSPGWPGTHDPPTSASQVLQLHTQVSGVSLFDILVIAHFSFLEQTLHLRAHLCFLSDFPALIPPRGSPSFQGEELGKRTSSGRQKQEKLFQVLTFEFVGPETG